MPLFSSPFSKRKKMQAEDEVKQQLAELREALEASKEKQQASLSSMMSTSTALYHKAAENHEQCLSRVRAQQRTHALQTLAAMDRLRSIRQTRPARDMVFSIAELHEKILDCMPIADFLRSEGVNSAWQNTINYSPTLQKRLFLKHDPASDRQGGVTLLPFRSSGLVIDRMSVMVQPADARLGLSIRVHPCALSEELKCYPRAKRMCITQPPIKQAIYRFDHPTAPRVELLKLQLTKVFG